MCRGAVMACAVPVQCVAVSGFERAWCMFASLRNNKSLRICSFGRPRSDAASPGAEAKGSSASDSTMWYWPGHSK